MLMVNNDAVVVFAGLLDEVIQVASADAIAFARQLAIKEVRAHPFIARKCDDVSYNCLVFGQGVFCGISSGAAVKAAVELSKRPENSGKVRLTDHHPMIFVSYWMRVRLSRW